MQTFEVSDVALALRRRSSVDLARSLKARTRSRVQAAASNLEHFVQCPGHPLVHAVHLAFAEHRPLALSPDDIWLCLVQGFGTHVSLRAEALRDRLVAHEGKRLLRVRRDEFLKGAPDNDWPGVLAEIATQLRASAGAIGDLIVADFSTTGPAERVASHAALMRALHPYFDYSLMTLCGIPRITLLGAVEDWQAVRRRVATFAEFDLAYWVDALLPLLDQFVAAAGGNAEREFWRSIYKVEEASGGDLVTGWINALFPYVEQAASPFGGGSGFSLPQQNPHGVIWGTANSQDVVRARLVWQYPTGLCRVPLSWEYLGREAPMEILSGFVGVAQDPETLTVRPAIGWAVCEADRSRAGAG